MVPPTFAPDVINDFLTPDAVNDFLTKRKNYRHALRAASTKSGSGANPDLVAPVSGEWTGTCKECRSNAFDGQEMMCSLSFKPCGTVEGTGSIPEGDFIIKGVYNIAKGIVAWRQSPLSTSSCEHESSLTAEFVGELTLAHGPRQQGSIVGSFLTASGNYYSVDLWDLEIQPHNAKLPLPLPTLLTGGPCTPKGAGMPTVFYSKNSNPSQDMEENESKPMQK